MQIPIYYNPSYGDPQNGTPYFGNPLCRGLGFRVVTFQSLYSCFLVFRAYGLRVRLGAVEVEGLSFSLKGFRGFRALVLFEGSGVGVWV